MSNRKNQEGFVVVSVLLVTSISTYLALSAINETRLQERIAGNQAKELNARSNAEQGIFTVYQYVQDNASTDLSTLSTEINTQSNAGVYELTSTVNGDNLIIVSEGQYQGAQAHLRAHIEMAESSGSAGPAGVVSCEGISLTGSGNIDSYDSREGTYNASNANSNANVITIEGDLILSGGTNISGDTNVNGDINLTGSGDFGGDLSASGDITLQNTTVGGSISSSGDIGLSGVTVGDGSAGSGDISAMGSISLAWGNEKTHAESGTSKGNVYVNGGMDAPGWFNMDNFSTNMNYSGAADAVMASNTCNQKDIANAFPTVDSENINNHMNAGNRGNGNANTELLFTESTAEVFDGSGSTTEISPSSESSTLWTGEESVYVFENLDLYNTMITIEGDVTIMVTGDLTTGGGTTGFQFADGDTTSSLTILVEGQVDVDSSVSFFAGAGMDDDKEVPLTIYSSFESSGENANANAVYMGGASNMYASVYAPLGNVEYAASGKMMGSLEGKSVKVSGSGDIHYDEALAESGGGDTATVGGARMAAIYYHYPS